MLRSGNEATPPIGAYAPPKERTKAPRPPPFQLPPQQKRSRKRPRENDVEEEEPETVPLRRFNAGRFNLLERMGRSNFASVLGEESGVEEYSGAESESSYDLGGSDSASMDDFEFDELEGPEELPGPQQIQPASAAPATALGSSEPPKKPEIRFVPVEPEEYRKKRRNLERALQAQGFENFDDAKTRCVLCIYEFDMGEGSVPAGAETRGPVNMPTETAGFKNKAYTTAIEGLNMVYANNLDAPEPVLFGLMQTYWETNVVAVIEDYEQEPVRLTREQIQLHFQYCYDHHPIESFRAYVEQADMIVHKLWTSGVHVQEMHGDKKVGESRISPSAHKSWQSAVKDVIMLKQAQLEQKNLYRAQFGIRPICARGVKRQRTSKTKR